MYSVFTCCLAKRLGALQGDRDERFFSRRFFGCAGVRPIADSPVQVNESGIRAVLRGGTTAITVPVSNQLGHTTDAALRLWWLLTSGESKLDQERTFEIAPGDSTLEMPFPMPQADVALRLGYRLGEQSGVVALAAIAQHVFELKLVHFDDPHPGDEYKVRAQAIHPLTRQTVECVKGNALELGEKKLRPVRSGRDAKGGVEFAFVIPQKSEAVDSFEVEVEGSCGDFSGTATVHAQINVRPIIHIQTDKPILSTRARRFIFARCCWMLPAMFWRMRRQI